jgi:hypothetical protein
VVLVLEHAALGSVASLLPANGGRLGERQAAVLVGRPLLAALAATHAQGITHGGVDVHACLLGADCQLRLGGWGGAAVATMQLEQVSATRQITEPQAIVDH